MKYSISKTALSGAIMAITFTSAWALPPGLPKAPKLEFNPPKGERRVLDNGLTVYLLKDPTLPAIRINAVVRTGNIYDPADKVGLGAITAGMLEDGGSAGYKADDIDKTLEYLGASMNSSMDTEFGSVSMFALKKDLNKVLDIYADILMNPAFEPEKFEIRRKGELEVIRRRNDDPGRAVTREALRNYYGKDHPYGRRAEIAGIESITAEDMKSFHAAYYKPNNIIMAVSGDYGSDEEILSKLNAKFGGWKKGEVKFPEIPAPDLSTGRKVYHIDKDTSQAFIVILQKGVKRPDPIEFPLGLTNDILGGSWGSRLVDTVRSKKGLAYVVYSSYSRRNARPGHLIAYCGTKPETYSQALEEILNQIKRVKTEPLTEQELAEAKNAKTNSFVFDFKTPFDIVSQRALLEHYGFPPDYLETYVKNTSAVTTDTAFAAASKLFDPDNAQIFVIGNSKKFDKPLSDFGPVTELKED